MTTRYDPYGIVIDGDELGKEAARDYEQSVKWHLDLIQHSQTGRALLSNIQGTGKRLTIRPHDAKIFNAEAQPRDWAAATPAGEYVLGQITTKEELGVPKALSNREGPLTGTGKGSEVELRYSPTMWGFGGSSSSSANPLSALFPPTGAGAGPSAVLFHEMAHAYREMRGTFHKQPMMGGRQLYDNEEEFFAILLSNIFVTDPTTAVQVRTLRADHRTLNQIATAQSTSQGFLQSAQNQALVAKFWAQEPRLMNDLLGVNASFNPIKQFKQPAPPATVANTTKVVVQGDTLSDLARKHYGSDEYWPLLWDANRAAIGPNPNFIRPGMPLSVPPFSSFSDAQLQDAKRRFPTWRNYH